MEKNSKQDRKTISKEWHELEYAAKFLQVKEWELLKAMDELKTNNRASIYAFFESLKTN
ncbi:MAG TPA: hypothetical protein VGB63_12980 [Pedobacter sp.]|jgi:hypothetical protein